MQQQHEFDVIVIGGGINGLTTAAYLSKAGLATAVVEKRHAVGTHCSTEEVGIPGVRHNLHASALMTGVGPIIEDLDLERFGLSLIGGEWNFMHPFAEGSAFLAHGYDPNVTYRKLQKFSKHDASAYKKMVNGMNRYVDELLPHYYTPASQAAQERFLGILRKIPEIPSGFEEMNGYDVLNDLFEDERVKTALAGYELAIGPKAREKYAGATGVVGTFLENSGPLTAFTARGGSSNLPHALERCILAHGGTIMENCEVAKIVIKDGEATGVQLSPGSQYPGAFIGARRAVVSNLTAVPTFLHLVGSEHLDRSAVRALRSFDYSGQTLFTVVYATDAPLKWSADKWDPDIDQAYWFHYGAESLKDVQRHEVDLLSGHLTDPIVSVGGSFTFTLRDSSQAPPGTHNITTWVNVPYHLAEGGAERWDEIREEVGERITDRIDEYAPGFKRSIRTSFSYSPLDIYRRNPSSIEANFCGGNLKVGQLYLDRPFPGCGAPRSPIRKLYLSNSTWPQSGSHLPTGYNAAVTVAEDLGVRGQPWWNHRPLGWFRKWVRERSGRDWSPLVTVD